MLVSDSRKRFADPDGLADGAKGHRTRSKWLHHDSQPSGSISNHPRLVSFLGAE